MSENYLWTEKYRPSTIEETILPSRLKDAFSEALRTGTVQNMLFSGTGGVGKTTVAKALCQELGLDMLFINGSEESGIDTLRTKIRKFASTVSLLNDQQKVVIIDEADYLNAQSTQPALRGFMEEFHDNCRFILTCNHQNRLIEQIHSRCAVFDFKLKKSELPQLAGQFLKRIRHILEQEKVEYTDKVLAEMIKKHVPDWRRVLNELQRYSVSGTIDSGILVNLADENLGSLVKLLKQKDFPAMRKWVANNIDLDTTSLFRSIYDNMNEMVKPSSTPQVVLILADYQEKAAFVADHEINIVAALTELMGNVEWK